MIATFRGGECTACQQRIRVGEEIDNDGDGWAHVKCPPARVYFTCECGSPVPCGCDEEVSA